MQIPHLPGQWGGVRIKKTLDVCSIAQVDEEKRGQESFWRWSHVLLVTISRRGSGKGLQDLCLLSVWQLS